MRLTDQQLDIIRTTVSEIFGTGADVWLFGSSADIDNKSRGVRATLELGKPLSYAPAR
jgi:hypothetical protein